MTLEDMKKAIAFLFKRKGRDSMLEKDFVMSASMDLHWFPPRDAQRLLEICLESRLLNSSDGRLVPGFEVSTVDLPLDYAPPQNILEVDANAPSLFLKVLDRIVFKTSMEKKQVVSMINSAQEELDLEADVAALVVGRELGVDISDFLGDAEKQILSRLG